MYCERNAITRVILEPNLCNLAERAYIRVQLPITLPPNSEPEPNIAVFCIDDREYFDYHPAPDEIFLLIEVARTTLNQDRIAKAPTYAKAKIPEYWVLDVQKRQVYVFRQLGVENY